MSMSEFRSALNDARNRLNAEAARRKDPQSVIFKLFDIYRRLGPDDRRMADQVIAEWVLSEHEVARFDGVALVDEFLIVSALPALRMLAARLEAEDGPGAPHEWAKVNRSIGRLTSA